MHRSRIREADSSATPQSPQLITRGRARGKGKTSAKNDRRSVSLDPVIGREVPSTSHSDDHNSADFHRPAARQATRDAIRDIRPREAAARHNILADLLTQQQADPLLNINNPPLPAQLINVNILATTASTLITR